MSWRGLRYSYEKAGGIIEDLDFERGRYLSCSRGITRDRAAASPAVPTN
jgi:hypothetical protein